MSISHNAILFFAALATAAGCTSTVSNDRKVNGEREREDE